MLSHAVDSGVEQSKKGGVNYEVGADLVSALKNDAFMFSGWKAYHTMREAGINLLNDKGGIKTLEQFKKEAGAIFKQQGLNLRAEYNHAERSTIMATNWARFAEDGDRYDLQYRTVGDNKVRDAHRQLNGYVAPLNSAFWDSYYPPNGWGCRCDVQQVRKGKYTNTITDEEATSAGAQSTVGDKQRIFRTNPGKLKKAFPPKHPNFPKGCEGCDKKKIYNLVTRRDPANPLCVACGVLAKECLKTQERIVKEWSKKNIPESVGRDIVGKNFVSGSLLVNNRSVKEVIGHTENVRVVNAIMGIEKNALEYKYIGWAECLTDKKTGKRKHPEVEYFVYYSTEIGGKTYYVNVKAHKDVSREVLYCIREKCNVKALNKGLPPNIDRYKKE